MRGPAATQAIYFVLLKRLLLILEFFKGHGRFRGRPSGPRPTFFLCNFVLFLMNSLKQNIDSSYITGKFPDRLFLNFRDPPLRIVLKEPFASNHR